VLLLRDCLNLIRGFLKEYEKALEVYEKCKFVVC